MLKKKSLSIVLGLIVVCVVVIVVSLIVCRTEEAGSTPWQSSYPMGVYEHGAVVSNGIPCAEIGKKILKTYGNAVDALIATMVCESAACIQNMGPGGGFILTGYIKENQTIYTLNARETAPAASDINMFHGSHNTSQYGGKSVAVPGELRGYYELYNRYGGKAPWAELFNETIALCYSGVPVSKHLASSIKYYRDIILESPTVSEMLMGDDGDLLKEGDLLKLPKLAETLKKVAAEGPDVLYNGSLTESFIRDIQEAGGIITKEDLADYTVRWEEPVKAPLSGNMTFYSTRPPGSGVLLSFILRLLDGHLNTGDHLLDVQRITEAFKFAYGRRTELGDPHFVNVTQIMSDLTNEEYIMNIRKKMKDDITSQDPGYYGADVYQKEDHGTANVAVIAPNGDAVVATSTVNLVFGSMLVSKSTGIVLNDEMDDFSAPDMDNYFQLPPSEANFIKPKKRPMSSMTPCIILDQEGEVRLAIGSAGGTRITTSTALVTIWNLWYNMTIKEAVDEPRFHHQLLPMEWAYEYGVDKRTVDSMVARGHVVVEVNRSTMMEWGGKSVVTAIALRPEPSRQLTASFDFRQPGSVAGF